MNHSFKAEQLEFEAQFKGLSAFVELFAGIGGIATSTEVGGMMSNLVIVTRRLNDRIGKVENRQKNTLINVTPFDIKSYKKILNNLSYEVDEALSSDIGNQASADEKDWMDVIAQENKDSAFAIYDQNEEFEHVRWYLMKNIKPNYDKFKDLTRQVREHLESLQHHLELTAGNLDESGKIYNKMLETYMQEEWTIERKSLISQTKRAIRQERKNGYSDEYILDFELDSMQASYLNGNQTRIQKRLYKTIIDYSETPVQVIVESRDDLTDDDISNYFSFLLKYNTLKAHIDTLPLLEPVTGDYVKLFTNQAAKEYFDLLLPIINICVESDSLVRYGLLLAAMGDLGIAQLKSKPYIQMKNYLSEKITKDEKLISSDHEMISLTVRNLKKVSFCELEYGDIGNTKIAIGSIKKYQDIYWRYFTILSQGGKIFPKNKKVASYLSKQHNSINLDTLLTYYYTPAQCMRLRFLISVLRGESLMFNRI